MPPAEEHPQTVADEQQLQVAAGAAAAVLEVDVPWLHPGISWRLKLIGREADFDQCCCAVAVMLCMLSHALRRCSLHTLTDSAGIKSSTAYCSLQQG